MRITVSFDVDVDLDAQAAYTGKPVAWELMESMAFLRVAAPRVIEGQTFMKLSGAPTAIIDLHKNP